MTWVRLEDSFFRHPKVVTAGRDARDLYIVGLCYCGAGLTDGRIPVAALRVLGAEAEIDDPKAAAERLIVCGLWERDGETFLIHDYHEYNPTKERVLATREARVEAGSRGGKQKSSNLLSKREANDQAKSKHIHIDIDIPETEQSTGAKAPADSGESPPESPPVVPVSPPPPPPPPPAPPPKPRSAKQQAADEIYERQKALYDAYCHGVGIVVDGFGYESRRNRAFGELKPALKSDEITVDVMERLSRYTATAYRWRDGKRIPFVFEVLLAFQEWENDGRPDEPKKDQPARASPGNRSRTDEAGAKLAAFQSISRGEHRLEP